MRGWRLAPVLLALSGVGCGQAGCQDRDTAPGAGQGEAPPAEAPSAAHTGTVKGVIRLAEGATLPRYDAEQMGRVEGAPHVNGCAPAVPEDGENVTLSGEARGLTGVMVTATGDSKTFFEHLPAHAPVERTLLLEACRLTPRLVIAMRGDRLVIKNQSAQPLFPVFGQASYVDSVLEGQTRTVPLDKGGITAVTCAMAPDCGRSDVVVVMNPVFTQTGEEGRFTLEGVPADQDVVIHAWHPLLVEARTTTRVSPGGEVTVELVLAPPPAR
jgi:hypothetical protein